MPERTKRNIYLKMKTVQEAQTIWSDKTCDLRTSTESVPTHTALGRVTAAPIIARRSVPHYHGAAMDGIAVLAKDTFGASDTQPLRLLLGEDAFAVDTGDPIPEGTDAVIMIENVEPVSGNELVIRSGAFPWQHVRKVGEDIVAGELLLPLHHLLRPADLGALLAAGVVAVDVFSRPKVLIQPTGTELIPAEKAGEAKEGQIIEFNGTVLSALVRECGGDPLLKGIVPDDYGSLKDRIRESIDSSADIILVNAGSSAGSEDFTSAIIAELGTVLVHGVTMMPGKPTILGIIDGKPIVGVPGYPVSAIIAFEQFVRPLIYTLQGMPAPAFSEVEAKLGRKMPSKLGLEEFVRVILGRVQDKLVAMPLQRGAGIITSLTRADGLLRIPQDLEGMEVDENVQVRLLRPEHAIENTLLMIGSHDNTIDVLANELKRRNSHIQLSSSNVGSLGGLLAIRRGQAHLAGSHLLDTETGGYNRAYVEKYLKGVPLRLVQLAKRQQGLLTRPGNPKDIRGIQDLLRDDVTFINRQAGSGTRILLDYSLRQLGVSPDAIKGYDQEEFTHMAVAVNVLSGRADAGMAIYASARALGLDFLPVAEERYDLVIPESSWNDSKLHLLREIIVSEAFRLMVTSLGGYDVSESGVIMGSWNGEEWIEEVEAL